MTGTCVVFGLLIMSVGQASLLAKGRSLKTTVSPSGCIATVCVKNGDHSTEA